MANNRLVECGFPSIDFPTGSPVSPGIFKGRNVLDGYMRSSLEWDPYLREKVLAHPLWREAFGAAEGRTVVTTERLMNLFLLVACFFEPLSARNIIEFGCYKGGTILFFSTLLQRLFPEARVYGFDTFVGMPETQSTLDLHVPGDFSDTSLQSVQDEAIRRGLANLTLIPGLVQDTFPRDIPKNAVFGLAHIDLDIYQPIKHAQDEVWSRMCRRGYLVYDDASAPSCLGATQAVEELIIGQKIHCEQIYPHFVFRAGLNG